MGVVVMVMMEEQRLRHLRVRMRVRMVEVVMVMERGEVRVGGLQVVWVEAVLAIGVGIVVAV